jgi:hypothetical protein
LVPPEQPRSTVPLVDERVTVNTPPDFDVALIV